MTKDGSNSSAGTGAGASPATSSGFSASRASDRVLQTLKQSLTAFPFDPVCGPKPMPRLINLMSTADAIGDGADAVASVSAAGDTDAAASAADSLINGMLPSQSPLSIIQSRSNTYISTFTNQLEQLISEYLIAVSVGAAVGAAVAAGIGMGCVAASGLVSGGKILLPSFWYGVEQMRLYVGKYLKRNKFDNDGIQQSESNDFKPRKESKHKQAAAKASSLGLGNNKVYVIRGDAKPQKPMSEMVDNLKDAADEQYRQCLDDLTCQLGKQLLGLQHVKRLTAYLMTDRCDAKDFREVLREYPLPLDKVVISIVYVQRLEEESSCVQIEALAAS